MVSSGCQAQSSSRKDHVHIYIVRVGTKSHSVYVDHLLDREVRTIPGIDRPPDVPSIPYRETTVYATTRVDRIATSRKSIERVRSTTYGAGFGHHNFAG